MRGATLFSGGGGVEALLKDRIEFVHAVEYDPAIAAVYRQNHGDHIQVADVCEVDFGSWGLLDYGHASPVCKEFSQAKAGGAEGDIDIQSALAVVRFLEACKPRVFTLENVGGYVRSQSYRLICQALDRGGYMWHAEVLNAADYGVPQTRRRLILRAVRDALLPGLPAPLPWVGWYAAISDLIPTLPESKFADWQLARLPEYLNQTVLVESKNANQQYGDGMRTIDEPAMTVVTDHKISHRPTAFIVHANDQRSMPVRDAADPMFTVAAGSHASHAPDVRPRAFLVNTQHTSEQKDDEGNRKLTIRDQDEPSLTILSSNNESSYRAWLSQGRVVKMTPRALARFQSLPDSYILPDKVGLACTIIGNCVPSLLMREVVLPLLGN